MIVGMKRLVLEIIFILIVSGARMIGTSLNLVGVKMKVTDLFKFLFIMIFFIHPLSIAQTNYDKKINVYQKAFLNLIQRTQLVVSSDVVEYIVKNSCKNYHELKSNIGPNYKSFSKQINEHQDTLLALTSTPIDMQKNDQEFIKINNEIYAMIEKNEKQKHNGVNLTNISKGSKIRKEKIVFLIKSLAWSDDIRIGYLTKGYKVEIANTIKNVIYPDLKLINKSDLAKYMDLKDNKDLKEIKERIRTAAHHFNELDDQQLDRFYSFFKKDEIQAIVKHNKKSSEALVDVFHSMLASTKTVLSKSLEGCLFTISMQYLKETTKRVSEIYKIKEDIDAGNFSYCTEKKIHLLSECFLGFISEKEQGPQGLESSERTVFSIAYMALIKKEASISNPNDKKIAMEKVFQGLKKLLSLEVNLNKIIPEKLITSESDRAEYNELIKINQDLDTKFRLNLEKRLASVN